MFACLLLLRTTLLKLELIPVCFSWLEYKSQNSKKQLLTYMRAAWLSRIKSLILHLYKKKKKETY